MTDHWWKMAGAVNNAYSKLTTKIIEGGFKIHSKLTIKTQKLRQWC